MAFLPAMPRRDFLALGASALALPLPRWTPSPHAARPIPSASQLAWQRDELALFAHFGVNTFTNREWGDGTESPELFNPTAFDARQWARTAKAAGFKMIILTAKHHDGFCLWPTSTTSHSVASSPFRGGTGDVVGEVADACRQEGLRLGLYLSPWDRNAKAYGTDGYHAFYLTQLHELLTRYGRVDEVWFDGANGEGPSGKRQQYDWPRYWSFVKELQPQTVIFSDAGPDVRWIGNERGVAGETNWAMVDPTVVPVPGVSGPAIEKMLQQGDPLGSVWRPGETDTSIRPGWFYHAEDDARVRTVSDLVTLYGTSVGRNSKLLLNVPPTRAGLLHDTDLQRLLGMRAALDQQFAEPLEPTETGHRRSADGVVTVEHAFAPRRSSVTVLQEPISGGQHISKWQLAGRLASGAWTELARGTTIGYKRVVSYPTTELSGIRFVVESSYAPGDFTTVRCYAEV